MERIAKYLLFIIVMEAVLVCFSGCSIEDFKRHKKVETDDVIITEEGDTKYKKAFGSYIVKSGWMESKTHSGNGKYFYVKEGEDNDKQPNNISINSGTNDYKKEDHEKFKDAIYAQLAKQVSGSKATVTASGSTLDNGELVYTFIIKSTKSVTKQYYIVGDEKFVVIIESVWNEDDEKDVDEIALKMLNSFEWSK
ncbi:MAG: hypothetical protein IKE91_04050 [Clostridia bacterium]|nr:hypothetical protein [Clostridia bacterium]